MKDKKIEEYDFVDCMLIDFKVDKLISTLFVTVESYYPLLSDGTRKKGLLKVAFDEIYQLSISKKKEFDFDIQLVYNKGGDDSKANEIYSIDISEVDDNLIKCSLESDMLNFNLQCKKIEIEELS